MNALREKFQCVVLLTTETGSSNGEGEGVKAVEEIAGALCAYQVTTVVAVAEAAPLTEQVVAQIHNFCDSHNMSFTDWGTDAASLLMAAEGRSLKHVSVLCSSASGIVDARRRLLLLRNPVILVVEFACDRVVPCAGVQDEVSDEWSWLRPKRNCCAELLRECVTSGAVCIPVEMRCSYPLIRAIPHSSSWIATHVTMDGLLREVGYKVGCLPKYGS